MTSPVFSKRCTPPSFSLCGSYHKNLFSCVPPAPRHENTQLGFVCCSLMVGLVPQWGQNRSRSDGPFRECWPGTPIACATQGAARDEVGGYILDRCEAFSWYIYYLVFIITLCLIGGCCCWPQSQLGASCASGSRLGPGSHPPSALCCKLVLTSATCTICSPQLVQVVP